MFHPNANVAPNDLSQTQRTLRADDLRRYGIKQTVFGMHEAFHAGVEPNKKLFKRFGCWYVGVQYRGWGKVVMAIRMEDSQK